MKMIKLKAWRGIFILMLSLSTLALSAQEWVTIEAGGDVVTRKDNGFMACKGKFYLIGGHGLTPVNIYDPARGYWSRGATPPVAMHHFQAIRIEDEIWVLGAFTGEYPDERPLEHIYIYDTEADKWSRGDPMPSDRLRGSAGVSVYRENIYLIGGTNNLHKPDYTRWVDRYNPKSGKWKKLADAPRNRGHFHAGICNGKIYAAGGSNPSNMANENYSGETVAEVDVYDIETGKWETLSGDRNIPTPRSGCATVTVMDHILVIGGQNQHHIEAFRLVEAYDIDRGEWEQWDMLKVGRCDTQAFMCVGAVFITAGQSDTKGTLASISLEKLIL